MVENEEECTYVYAMHVQKENKTKQNKNITQSFELPLDQVSTLKSEQIH